MVQLKTQEAISLPVNPINHQSEAADNTCELRLCQLEWMELNCLNDSTPASSISIHGLKFSYWVILLISFHYTYQKANAAGIKLEFW